MSRGLSSRFNYELQRWIRWLRGIRLYLYEWILREQPLHVRSGQLLPGRLNHFFRRGVPCWLLLRRRAGATVSMFVHAWERGNRVGCRFL